MKKLGSWSGWLVMLVATSPAVALACPACAGRQDANPAATFALIASFIAVPYIAGFTVVRIVRRLAREDAAQEIPNS